MSLYTFTTSAGGLCIVFFPNRCFRMSRMFSAAVPLDSFVTKRPFNESIATSISLNMGAKLHN